MLLLVLAGNFLLLYAGWELVGICSFLLISFHRDRPSAAAAAKKAFVVNRIGDLGFLLGILLVLATFGSLDFDVVFRAIADHPLAGSIATAIPLLLFLGATGKSAQIPLHVWLPDAMEGPTPVSALIHAATMVTAGVYMIARLHPLFEGSQTAATVVAVVGIATALYAATRSRWSRTTSSVCWPTPRSRSWATCSSRWGSARSRTRARPTRPASSIS
ncbi:MAG: proton-conducting transporter membrane subunit [Actinomycetota bacterium]